MALLQCKIVKTNIAEANNIHHHERMPTLWSILSAVALDNKKRGENVG